jgi:nitrate reductase assembly molybdenum cofactor insertion protein NarJ
MRPEPPEAEQFTAGEVLAATLANAVEDATKAYVQLGAMLLKSLQTASAERQAANNRRRQRLQACQDALRRTGR